MLFVPMMHKCCVLFVHLKINVIAFKPTAKKEFKKCWKDHVIASSEWAKILIQCGSLCPRTWQRVQNHTLKRVTTYLFGTFPWGNPDPPSEQLASTPGQRRPRHRRQGWQTHRGDNRSCSIVNSLPWSQEQIQPGVWKGLWIQFDSK